MCGEVRAALRERGRVGRNDDSRLTVGDDLQRAAGVGRREHRLACQERFVWDHAEVLVDRCVVHGEAPRVQVGEAVVVDPAGELHLPVQTGGEALEALAIGAFADDHEP